MFRGTENQRLWCSTNSLTMFNSDEDMLEAYNEHADDNMQDIKTEVDQEVEEYIDWLMSDLWEEKLEGALNLKNVVVTGSFGAWDGPKEIFPERCKDIEEAIEKCCVIRGDWDADVYFEKDKDGVEHLVVGVSHHDGTCRYEISLLLNPDEEDEDKYKLGPISHKMVFGA